MTERPANDNDPLDRTVAEQAACYVMPVDRFTRMMSNMAELQEQAEAEGWDG